MNINNEKNEIRKNILNFRNKMDLNTKRSFDNSISNRLFESNYYKNSKRIFIYVSYKSEIDTKRIINKAIKDNKAIYIPRTDIKNKYMDAVEIKSLDNLIEDKYGILEPDVDAPCIEPGKLDLIIVPGVGFDRDGGRLGYGAGYYDRYFKKIGEKSIKKLALAYDFQIIDKIPMDEFDKKIDAIITEKETIQV